MQESLMQESRRYRDLLLLGIRENMNGGKTLEFFVAAAYCWGNTDVAWIAKMDDDSYVSLSNLQHAHSYLFSHTAIAHLPGESI